MKKTLTILMATILAILCFAMVGCKDEGLKESTVVGTYEIVSMSMADDENSVEYDKEALEQIGYSMTIVLNKDKTLTADMDGETATGTWKINGKRVAITIEGETQEFSYSKGYLSYSATQTTGDYTMTMSMQFKKVTSSASSSDESETSIVGTWNLTSYLYNGEEMIGELGNGTVSFIFKADGTFEMLASSSSTNASTSGTYEVNGNVVTAISYGEPQTFTIQADGTLVCEDDGLVLTFTKA